jgi:succinate dehydrogenase / fumarate reductase flavoprotein subunit
MELNSKSPSGPIETRWERHRFNLKLVNPANKRKYTIIVVGTGLAGGSAAASLGELGYNVLNFCIQDSPRRAHSIAAQGGINAAKNYQNDGDSIYRLFYDTVKGGDYRSRESNVYRLAQLSVNIIDQCVAQGVPFAREYGGLLDNRSFGGAQVSRTFYARGQTGQQLLIGAYQSLMRQGHEKRVRLFARREMLDVVVIDGKARGIVVRNLVTGRDRALRRRSRHPRHGRLRNSLYLSTKRGELQRDRGVARTSAARSSPTLLHAIHPTCIGDAMAIEAHADEREPPQRRRVWVLTARRQGPTRFEAERDYYLERKY